MTMTALTDVASQIQQFWAPTFSEELRNSLLLGSIVNRSFEGDIKKGGDTVTISCVNAPTGQLLTIGSDADGYTPEAVSMSHVHLKVDKRAVASYSFSDLVELQSQVNLQNDSVRKSLMYAMQKQIESYLLTLIDPSTSNPDHLIGSVTDFNAAALAACRMRASQAKWDTSKPWIVLCDPSYYSDLLNASTLVNSDNGATDFPLISGKIGMQRYGFQIYEHNLLPVDTAIVLEPSFMNMAIQQEVQVKVSDLHPTGKFGYNLSVDCIFGAALGIQGAIKHQKITASA